MAKKIKTSTIPATENSANPKIGSLVYCVIGVCIFLGFEDRGGDEDFIKVARVKNDGSREVSWTLRSYIYIPSTIDDLARVYRSSMEFYDHSSVRDGKFDSGIEDLIQHARADAHALARAAVQRIRDLDEPHNVDGASVFLDFAERSGADVERKRVAFAVARERRRVEMGFAPFCAATYFKKMREYGDEPYAVMRNDGGLGIGFSAVHGDGVQRIRDWAFYEDSDFALRKECARSVWEARPASDWPVNCQLVPLGV
jgi:hypothetical protein